MVAGGIKGNLYLTGILMSAEAALLVNSHHVKGEGLMSKRYGDPKKITCPACDGKGYIVGKDGQPQECNVCHGTGKAIIRERPAGSPQSSEDKWGKA